MIFGRNPVLISTAIMALVALGVAFGLDWSGEQVASIEVAVGAVLAVIANRSVNVPG